MNTVKKIFASVAFLAAFCACEKEITVEITKSAQTSEKQIITATVNCPTKVAYSENISGGGNGISSVWQEGDSFYAIQDDETVVTFTLSSGAGSHSATFTAETSGVSSSTKWVAVLGKGASVHAAEIHCGYMNQKGTIADLNNVNYVQAEGTGLKPSFNFDGGKKLSYILRLKLPAGIKCIEYTPCAYWIVNSTEAKRAYYTTDKYPSETLTVDTSDPATNYAGWLPENTSTITLASASKAGDIVYIAVPALNHNKKKSLYSGNEQYTNFHTGVIVTILNGTSDEATASNGSVVDEDASEKGGQVVTWDMSSWSLLPRPKPSDAIHITTSESFTESDTGFYFDVTGSDVYWSPFNIGASQPQQVGNYYAWGDISTPEERGRTEGYTFVSHTVRGQGPSASTHYYNVIQIAMPGKYYFTIRGSRYDVARVKWGKAWRTPGFIEIYCTLKNSSPATVSGLANCLKYGDLVIPKSNAIKGTDEFKPKDRDGAYIWSSDILRRGRRDPYKKPWYVGTTANGTSGDWFRSPDAMERYIGLPVRPVLAESEVSVEYRKK